MNSLKIDSMKTRRSLRMSHAAKLRVIVLAITGCSVPLADLAAGENATGANSIGSGIVMEAAPTLLTRPTVSTAQPIDFATAPNRPIALPPTNGSRSAAPASTPATRMPSRVSADRLIQARDQVGGPQDISLTGGRPIRLGHPAVVLAATPSPAFQTQGPAVSDAPIANPASANVRPVVDAAAEKAAAEQAERLRKVEAIRAQIDNERAAAKARNENAAIIKEADQPNLMDSTLAGPANTDMVDDVAPPTPPKPTESDRDSRPRRLFVDAETDSSDDGGDQLAAIEDKSSDGESKSDVEMDATKEQQDSAPSDDDTDLPAPTSNNAATRPSDMGTQPLSVAEAVRVALSQNKLITVLGYVPQEVGTAISAERAIFDPVFEAGVRGGSFDRQYRNFINTGGFLPGGAAFGDVSQDTDFFTGPDRNLMSISKMFETGAIVEAGVAADYIYDNPVGEVTFLNPAWGSALTLSITQPLGRDMGREVTTAPLRIARANQTIAGQDFQAAVNATLRDVQLAYWDWKLAQRNYRVTQDAVVTALKTVELEKDAVRLGEGTLPDLEQASDQWQQFRIDATIARNVMNKARITLVQLMGLPLSNISYDFAIDEPSMYADYDRTIGESTALSRPELQSTYAAIRAAEIEVRLAANALRPDIDLSVDYAVTGLERNLDDAVGTVFDNRFNDWIVQLEYRRAAGLRAECAELRRARLRLSRAIAERDEVQQGIMAEVARSWEDLMTSLETLRIQNERVETARAQVKGRDELYTEGEGTLDLKIRAEATLVDALLQQQAAEIAVQQATVNWRYVTAQQDFVQFVE